MIIIINHPLVITIFMGGKNRGKNTIPSVMGNPRTAPALQRMTLGICWLWTLWPERAPKKRRVSGGPRVKKSREVLRCREPCERPAPQCRLLPMCQRSKGQLAISWPRQRQTVPFRRPVILKTLTENCVSTKRHWESPSATCHKTGTQRSLTLRLLPLLWRSCRLRCWRSSQSLFWLSTGTCAIPRTGLSSFHVFMYWFCWLFDIILVETADHLCHPTPCFIPYSKIEKKTFGHKG